MTLLRSETGSIAGLSGTMGVERFRAIAGFEGGGLLLLLGFLTD